MLNDGPRLDWTLDFRFVLRADFSRVYTSGKGRKMVHSIFLAEHFDTGSEFAKSPASVRKLGFPKKLTRDLFIGN